MSFVKSRLTECNVFVQGRLKVASKAVEHRVAVHRESEALIPVIVHIWKKEKGGQHIQK